MAKTTINEELSRMSQLMNYGKSDDAAKKNDSMLEHYTEGADGKMYGIVREGTKFYIKEAKKKSNNNMSMLAEDFNYIGSWMNRKSNEYSSFTNALKNFDQKMMSLAEAYHKEGKMITESLDPSKKENVIAEETSKMRNEINRQRRIMENASLISEGKAIKENSKNECCPVIGKDAECGCGKCTKSGSSSKNSGSISVENGPKAEQPKKNRKKLGEGKYVNIKGTWYNKQGNPVNESEVLAWNREDKDYMDTTNGTEIGNSKPFTKTANDGKENHASHSNDNGDGIKNGVVEGKRLAKKVIREGMEEPTKFNGYRQVDDGLPSEAGNGEVGDGKPFDDKVKDDVNECGDTSMMEDVDIDDTIDDEEPDSNASQDADNDEISIEDNPDDSDEDGDIDIDIDDDDDYDDDDDDDVMDLLGDIKDKISDLEDKISGADFDDDELYPDDEDDNDETEFEITPDEGNDDNDEKQPTMGESFRRRGRLVKEDRMNYFGKHPAYRKKVMTLPNSRHNEFQGYKDWNDESTMGEQPYGEKIGSGSPFKISPKTIDNAIAESIRRIAGGKKKV